MKFFETPITASNVYEKNPQMLLSNLPGIRRRPIYASSDDLTVLSETAKVLHVIDEWFTDEGLAYFRLATVTVSLPLAAAPLFVRGLLRRHSDVVRGQG